MAKGSHPEDPRWPSLGARQRQGRAPGTAPAEAAPRQDAAGSGGSLQAPRTPRPPGPVPGGQRARAARRSRSGSCPPSVRPSGVSGDAALSPAFPSANLKSGPHISGATAASGPDSEGPHLGAPRPRRASGQSFPRCARAWSGDICAPSAEAEAGPGLHVGVTRPGTACTSRPVPGSLPAGGSGPCSQPPGGPRGPGSPAPCKQDANCPSRGSGWSLTGPREQKRASPPDRQAHC